MTRTVHNIDAKDQVLGRLATRVATILIGKHKAGWRPHVDSGDFVEVRNVGAIRLTGKKIQQKAYFHYSGYPGGLKTRTLGVLMQEKPKEILRAAVRRMLPKNKHLVGRMKRLRIV